MTSAVAPDIAPQDKRTDTISRDDLNLLTPFVAPRTTLEANLADIWRRAFNLDSVGVQDNFFDLRGDSVYGAAIMTEVEQTYGFSFGLSVLIASPTLETFARFIVEKTSDAYSSVLFPLRENGSKAPLFLVHGRGGQMFPLPAFTSNLDPERPVYGFQARGLNGRESPHTSIEAMADDYVGAMRSVQPRGPYTLGSFCAGSHIAIEIARNLHHQGEELRPLILIDPPTTPPAEERRFDRKIYMTRIRRIMRRRSVKGIVFGENGRAYLARILRHFLSPGRRARASRDNKSYERFARGEQVGAEQKRQYQRVAQMWAQRRETGKTAIDVSAPEDFEAATWTSYLFANALRQYEPAPYDGEVEAILSEDRAIRAADSDFYLRSLVSNMRVHVAGTSHFKMLTEQVSEVAKTINEILRNAP